MRDTAKHEASHAACAIWLGRRVDHVWRTAGFELAGDTVGTCRVPVDDQIEVSQVPIALVGYWSEETPNWPPPWPDCLDEKRESLGRVLTLLGATEEVYEQLVELARDMLGDPDVIRLRDALARALRRAPRLEREDVEALARIYLPREDQPCSA